MIAVLSTEAKIATYMVLQRLKQELGNKIPLQQTGFAPHTRVELAVSGTSAFIKSAQATGKAVLATTVDIRKAFDTVDREILLGQLEASEISQDILYAMRSYFTKTQVELPGGTIHYTRGVVQGCVLSPLLFAVYTTPLAGCIAPGTEGKEQALFLYADDILLLSTNAVQHAATLRDLVAKVGRLRLAVHPDKCHTLVIGPSEAQQRTAWDAMQMALDPEIAHLFSTQAQEMKYLGHVITDKGLAAASVTHRGQAENMANRIAAVARKHDLQPWDTSVLCKTYVVPLLDWGHAVPTLPQGAEPTSWQEIDGEDDRIAALAFAGPTFGALTKSPQRRIPAHILCTAVNILPARERRSKLAKGLAASIARLSPSHPVLACIEHDSRTNIGTGPTLKQLFDARQAATLTCRQNAPSRVWASTLQQHGTCHRALQQKHPTELRRACLKLRCNTNTFLPGDALRMGKKYVTTRCTHEACLGVSNSLPHQAFYCTRATAAQLRSQTEQKLLCALSPGDSTSINTTALLQAAATGDSQRLRTLLRSSDCMPDEWSAAQQLQATLHSIAWEMIVRIMTTAKRCPSVLGIELAAQPGN